MGLFFCILNFKNKNSLQKNSKAEMKKRGFIRANANTNYTLAYFLPARFQWTLNIIVIMSSF